jgi:hypothetical protein
METTRLLVLPESPVWVMEDRGTASFGQAAAIAGRLGLPFRRIGAAGTGGQVPDGSAPTLVLSAGPRAAAQALLLRARHGSRIVHCASTRPPLPAHLAGYPFDRMVLPVMDAGPPAGHRLIPALGPLHVVSPALLARARDLWAERLAHLPSPRIVVLLGGAMPDAPTVAALARRLAQMARERHGCVLVAALADCRTELVDAFASGLGACINLVHRDGEPGENPTLGFLGGADAVIAAWTDSQALSEACAATAPVFVVQAPGGRASGLAERLVVLDQVRPLLESLLPWSRIPLDEAGRIARTIRTSLLGGTTRPRPGRR